MNLLMTGSCTVRPGIYDDQDNFINNLGSKNYVTNMQTSLYDLQTATDNTRLNVNYSIRLLCSGITAQTVLFYQLDIQKVLEHHNG